VVIFTVAIVYFYYDDFYTSILCQMFPPPFPNSYEFSFQNSPTRREEDVVDDRKLTEEKQSLDRVNILFIYIA